MKRILAIAAAAVMVAALAACAATQPSAGRTMPMLIPADSDRLAASRDRETAARVPLLASAEDDAQDTPLGQRIVIYKAGFRVVVRDVDTALKSVQKLAEQYGGYVQQIQGNNITIRIPVAKYQEAVSFVEGLGPITQRELQAADVTEDYVDLEARLKNALAVRQRLEALLGKTEDVKAAIEVERELKRIGEEIETLQAKLELIRNRVAFSTISVAFERVAPQAKLSETIRLPFGWLRELDPNRLWKN